MELTCLNCAGTFEVTVDVSGAGERSIQCPMCGQEQSFTLHEESPFTSYPPPPPAGPVEAVEPKAGSSESSAFKRPMQAFSGFTRRKVVEPGKLVDDTSSAMKKIRKHKDTSPDGEMPRVEKEPSGPLEEVTPPDGGNGSSTWLVKSPTGLVLEFPTSHLLVNWSAIVDKPGAYTVSKGGDSWQGLSDFLEEVRQGNRGTAAFRRLAKETGTGQTPGSGMHSVDKEGDEKRVPSGTDGAPPVENGQVGGDESERILATSPTSQFQFKIRESKENKGRGWLVFAVVAGVVILACGAVAALYLSGLI